MFKRNPYFTAAFLLSFLFVACSSEGDKRSVNMQTAMVELIGQDTVRVLVTSNDKMQFDVDKIIVPENKTVVLTLQHTGTLPKSSMGHNLVILEKNVSFSDFTLKALVAKENDYIPETEIQNIIAYTGLLGGGESDTIVFKTPERGSYDFLCSFPGHYSIMKGKFIVE